MKSSDGRGKNSEPALVVKERHQERIREEKRRNAEEPAFCVMDHSLSSANVTVEVETHAASVRLKS
jgi:hypothetical protein